jgi:pilus assembly protein CpaE
MTNESNVEERANQAIFSVCVDEAVVNAATSASFEVTGAHFAGEFRDYITSDKRPQFSPSLKNAASCVALIDFDRDPELAIQTTERLSQIFLKKISIVGVGAKLDAGILLRAVRNGCTEFLTKPVDPDDLVAALNRFQAVMAVDPHAQNGIGRVIAFFGAKGGVGTTMLAVHLATHLVCQHGKKTLLIDHKQQLGHVALYLGLKDTQYHFDELLRNADRLDAELLDGFVVRHRSGLDVIASPEMASGPHEPKGDQLEHVMDFLRREYDYVLIDSSVAFQDAKTSILEQSDEVYIVSTPDVAALRDLARLVENLSLSDSATSKLHVVVNRSTATDSITSDQIEKAVRFPITVAIPNNYFELQRAINDGEPIPPQRRSEFNQAIARWANRVVHGVSAPKPPPAKKGLFSFLH